jgi:sulfide dehydrogenase cytochrome subunit
MRAIDRFTASCESWYLLQSKFGIALATNETRSCTRGARGIKVTKKAHAAGARTAEMCLGRVSLWLASTRTKQVDCSMQAYATVIRKRMMRRLWQALLLAFAGFDAVLAAPPPDKAAWVWATTCMACHGTGGDASGASLRLKDLGAKKMHEQLLAFKTGTRPSTVMRQHTSGYSDDELLRIARVFETLDRSAR